MYLVTRPADPDLGDLIGSGFQNLVVPDPVQSFSFKIPLRLNISCSSIC